MSNLFIKYLNYYIFIINRLFITCLKNADKDGIINIHSKCVYKYAVIDNVC